jgi:hypothetical protein
LEEHRHHHLRFEASEGSAEAVVDSAAEGEYGAFVAVQAQLVGLGELLWVAVGGAEQIDQSLARVDLKATHSHLVRCRASVEDLHRRVIAQRFLG